MLSKYSIKIDSPAGLFITNVFTGSAVRIGGIKTADVVDERLSLPEEEMSCLSDLGIIDENSFHNSERVMERYRTGQKQPQTLDLTITPTMGCNYSCYYCFEKKTDDFKSKLSMSQETIDQLTKYISFNMNGRKKLNVFWFGGEPTTERETIEQLSKRFTAICSDNSAEYNATIISNGSLIDREYINFLKLYKITKIQLTIDGHRERHNRTRHDGKHESSYDHLISLASFSNEIRIAYRINITEPVIDNYKNILNDIVSKDVSKNSHIYFAPIMEFYSGSDQIIKSTSHRFVDMQQFSDFESELLLYMQQLGFPFDKGKFLPRTLPCSAVHWGSIIVDPAGKLLKCDHELGVKSASFGDIWNGATNKEAVLKWMNRGPWQNIGCSECSLLPSCMGHCADYHDRSKSRSQACPSIKYNTATQLSLLSDQLKTPLRKVGRIEVLREIDSNFKELDRALDQ